MKDEKIKFLLVDDDQGIIGLTRRALEMNFPDCIVLTAETGADGLAQAGQGKPDIIILDVNLPVMNGFEVCNRLKSDEATSHIPIVMVSGDRMESASRVLGLESGADGYLFKPYTIDEFVAQMRVMLRIKQTEDRLKAQKQILERAFSEQTVELKRNKEALEHKVGELEEVINRQMQELIRADRLASAGVIAAGLAHEVNNPNTFISSNLTTFRMFWTKIEAILSSQNNSFSPEEKKTVDFIIKEMPNLLQGMEKGSKRIGIIVNGMKSYASESSEQRRIINLQKVVEEALRMVADQLRPHVTVENRLAGEMPPVLGSEQLLNQVFVNLLLNAGNAIRETGAPGSITITGCFDDLHAEILVRDTGPGIAPEHMKELFSPFFTTRRDEGGTGLGLFVCYGIIKGHNGKIEVESSSSQGTVFNVKIPRLNHGDREATG